MKKSTASAGSDRMAAQAAIWQGAYFGILLIGSAMLGGYYYIGPFGSDDLQYVQLVAGGAPALGTGRFAISGYYWLLANWLGIQQAAYSFFLFGAAIGIATYLLSKRFVPEHVAMLSGLLAAFNPLTFYYSAAILPDNPLGLFYVIHVGTFAIYAWGRGGCACAALSGAMLAACYATKEASMVFAAPTALVGAWLLATRRASILRGVVVFVVAFVAVIAVDIFASWLLLGDPVFRLTYSVGHDVVGHARKYMDSQGVLPWERLAYVVDRSLAFIPKSVLLLNAVAIVAMPLLAWRHRRDLLAPAIYASVSAFVVVAYLTWGTISLKDYVGVPLQVRYYLPAVPIGAVCTATFLWAGSRWVARAPRVEVTVFSLLGLIILGLQVKHPAPHAGRAYRAPEVIAIGRAVAVVKRDAPGVQVVGDTYVSGRYAAYGPQMGVLGREEISRRSLRDFIFVVADANRRKDVEMEAVRRCAESMEEIGQPGSFLVPATRGDAISLMLGDPSNVRFESNPRVRVFAVHALRNGCQI